jgi:SAM-dependent methyltransferase
MGITIKRAKPKLIWISVFYRLHKLLPLSKKAKFKFYMNMTWMFERLSHEMSFEYYAPENHPLRLVPQKFIYKFLQEDFTVLDLGCATAAMSNALAQKARRVVGIDHDKVAIEKAKKTYKRDNLEFYHDDAFKFLQKNEGQFDVLILSHILEHLDDPKEFVFKFKDFFKYIYIELPDFDKTYLNQYRKDLNMQLIYTDNDHVSEFDRYELIQLLKECNVTIIEAVYHFGIQQLWCKVEK